MKLIKQKEREKKKKSKVRKQFCIFLNQIDFINW